MFYHGSYMICPPAKIPSLQITEKEVENYDFVEVHLPELRKNFPNKKVVLIHNMINFDPIEDLKPFGWNNFFALKIEFSERIKRTEENENLLRKFCESIPIKKILVIYNREWEDYTQDGVIVSKIICENDFMGIRKWGNMKTIRNPKDLELKPQKEYWITFTGYEGKFCGEYPEDTLRKYKNYFESFDAKFYISWYIEVSSIVKISLDNCVDKSIETFKNIRIE